MSYDTFQKTKQLHIGDYATIASGPHKGNAVFIVNHTEENGMHFYEVRTGTGKLRWYNRAALRAVHS